MLNEKVRAIHLAAGVESQEPERDYSPLVESGTLASEFALKGLTPLRQFMGYPPDIGGRRPSAEFYGAFLSSGKAGAVALLRAFEAGSRDPAETRRTIEAACMIPRVARLLSLVEWSLDYLRPEAVDAKEKQKLGVYLTPEVVEGARLAALEAKVS